MFIYPQWTIHAGDWRWWLPLVGIVVVTALLWRGRNRPWVRAILFAWAFYLLALLPALGFTDISFMQYSLVADHYQHLALVAVVALAAAAIVRYGWAVHASETRRWLAGAAAIAAAGILMLLSTQQAELYAGPIPLYTATLEKNPNCWMLNNNLGAALIASGRPKDAIPYFERALKIKSNYPEAHDNWGRALNELGQPQDAIAHFRQALELDRHDTAAMNNWAAALVKLGQPDEAIKQYHQALEINPRLAEVRSNLGTLLAAKGEYAEAIDYFEQALHDRPDLAEVHRKLAAALLKTGRPQQAAEQCRAALQLQPDDVEAFAILAQADAQSGRIAEAILDLETAITLAQLQGRSALAQELQTSLAAFRARLTTPRAGEPHPDGRP